MAHISQSLILITLLVELGVAAAMSSSLARSKTFKRLLLADRRTPRQTAELVALICVPLVLGVLVRVKVPNFLAADISFETTILLGVLVGPLAAMAGIGIAGGLAIMNSYAFTQAARPSLGTTAIVQRHSSAAPR